MQNIKLLFIIFLFYIVTSCKKEKNDNWIVDYSGSHQYYDHIEFIENIDFSKKKLNVKFKYGSLNVLWSENHFLFGNIFRKDINKQFGIEIQDTTDIVNFYYTDSQIFDSLKGYVIHSFYTRHDGTYKIRNGFVFGEKINGEWIIDFEITYGGKNNDKFRMVKDANY